MGFTIQGSATLSTREQQGRSSRKTRTPFLSCPSEGKVSSLLCEHYLSSEFCLSAFAFRRLFIFHSSLGFFIHYRSQQPSHALFLRLIHSSAHLDVLKSCSTVSVEQHRCSVRRYLAIEQAPSFYSMFFYPIFYVELRSSCAFQPDFHLIVPGLSSPELLRGDGSSTISGVSC